MNIETDDCMSNDLTGPSAAPGWMIHIADHGRQNGPLGGKMAFISISAPPGVPSSCRHLLIL